MLPFYLNSNFNELLILEHYFYMLILYFLHIQLTPIPNIYDRNTINVSILIFFINTKVKFSVEKINF